MKTLFLKAKQTGGWLHQPPVCFATEPSPGYAGEKNPAVPFPSEAKTGENKNRLTLQAPTALLRAAGQLMRRRVLGLRR